MVIAVALAAVTPSPAPPVVLKIPVGLPVPSPTKKAVTIVPKPEQSGTKVGIQNLKPGQKVKVTIKSGARP